jgi:quinol monooxygenase YgiN
MSKPSVSIHPYFKVHPGKLEEAKALLPDFVARTSTETTCDYYDFTISGDTIFCREAYRDAEAALAHVANVDAPLKTLLSISDMVRLELHGPAEELEKLKEPLAALNPTYFTYAAGMAR